NRTRRNGRRQVSVADDFEFRRRPAERHAARPGEPLAENFSRRSLLGGPGHQVDQRLESHVEAVENRSAQRTAAGVAVEKSVRVQHHRRCRKKSIVAGDRAEIVENLLGACGRDLEDRSVIFRAAIRSYTVEVAIGAERQPRYGKLRVVRVGAPNDGEGETVEQGIFSGGRDLENSSISVGGTAAVGRPVKIAVRALNQDSYGPASVGGITREVVERCDLARRRRFVNHPAVGAVVAAILRGAVKIAVRALCRKVGTLAVGVVEGVSGDFAVGRELKESSVLASVRFLGNAIEVTVLPLENGIDRAAIVFDSAQAAGKRIDWCQGSTGRDLEYRSEAVFAAVG